MPTMLDVKRKWRAIREKVSQAGAVKTAIAVALLALLFVTIAIAATVSAGVFAMITILALDRLFRLELDPTDGWNLLSVLWFWWCAYTLARLSRSKPAKEEKR